MLRAVRLVNLRSLGDTGEIALRPLTMLVGANSSGKSTLLRFFPLLRQTDREESGSPLLFFGADVDFGEFKDALGRHGGEPVIGVGLSLTNILGEDVEIEVEVEQDGDLGSYVRRVTLSVNGDRAVLRTDAAGMVTQLLVNGEDVRPVLRAPAVLRVRSLIPTFLDGLDELVDLGSELIVAHIRTYAHGRTTPERAEAIEEALAYGTETFIRQSISEQYGTQKLLDNLNERGLSQLKQLLLLRDLGSYLHWCSNALRSLARAVDYIGPFRSAPQRFYRRRELAVDRVSKDGDNVALILNALSPEERAGLSEWMRKYFGFGVALDRDGSHLVLTVEETPDVRVNLIDTGFGLSQVLPVIVQSWLGTLPDATPGPLRPSGEPAQLFAIEQPELHLHPRHQAHLADMFVGLIRGTQDIDRHMPILVETHSEALINRLGELVAGTALKPEEVSVLVFERDAGGKSMIRRAEFDAQGVLNNWPFGFFLA